MPNPIDRPHCHPSSAVTFFVGQLEEVEINGRNAAPLYKFLKSSKGGIFGDSIKWNFTKFLADKDGKVIHRYAPTTSPLSIEKDIKKLLEVSTNKSDNDSLNNALCAEYICAKFIENPIINTSNFAILVSALE